jgi:hypothetical protein
MMRLFSDCTGARAGIRYLCTVLSEGFDFDLRAPGRWTLPRSLAAAIGDHLWVLPPETRSVLELLAVLNLRMPLAQLGQAAQVESPGTAIEPAVASGLVAWWPEEPTCPVEIRHPWSGTPSTPTSPIGAMTVAPSGRCITG